MIELVALIIFVVIMIIGIILLFAGAFGDSDSILWLVGSIMSIVGFLGTMITLFVGCSQAASAEQNKKAEGLSRLAKSNGASNFCCNIGTVNSPFRIDTVHGLFAGECVVDTVKKTVVAPLSHILACSLDEETRTVNNAKSRAIVGGLLAGSVGAIAGAASAKERQQFAGYVLTIVTDLPDFGTMQYHNIPRNYGLQVVQYLKH